MVCGQGRLLDGQGALVQRLGLRIPAFSQDDDGEAVQQGREVAVVRRQGGLPRRQGAAQHGFGLSKLALSER